MIRWGASHRRPAHTDPVLGCDSYFILIYLWISSLSANDGKLRHAGQHWVICWSSRVVKCVPSAGWTRIAMLLAWCGVYNSQSSLLDCPSSASLALLVQISQPTVTTSTDEKAVFMLPRTLPSRPPKPGNSSARQKG